MDFRCQALVIKYLVGRSFCLLRGLDQAKSFVFNEICPNQRRFLTLNCHFRTQKQFRKKFQDLAAQLKGPLAKERSTGNAQVSGQGRRKIEKGTEEIEDKEGQRSKLGGGIPPPLE